ncbi:DUF2637 domain-containing protein [Streptomyces sp. NPDC048442]|uniref:DUF2637 domain-containing protein n=1 Tax=Streptomyces sp. NPDC048442 TaxID=3154823 RepID=UPI003431E5BD
MQLTRTHRILIGVVVTGAVVIAGIGFAGSYAAVRELAMEKGFGDFSRVFPIGIDAGICVLLALDLLLTWMRIPFPLLRQTAWLLTAATIAFNGAASWPDPLGVGMHAVIPVLFVVSVEAARHAIGRIADITADKHMEGVRLTRWLLSPVPTFKLWRRMKLWELRSYERVIKLEQDRLIYRARLQARYGRSWKRKAPVEALMPLRLAKIGVPLAETAAVGLAAAGIEPTLLPPLHSEQPAPLVSLTKTQVPDLTAGTHPDDTTVPAQDSVPEPETEERRATAHARPDAELAEEPVRTTVPGAAHGADLPHEQLADTYYEAYRECAQAMGGLPTTAQFGGYLAEVYGIADPDGQPLAEKDLSPVVGSLRKTAEKQEATEPPAAPSADEESEWLAETVGERPAAATQEHPFFGGTAAVAAVPAQVDSPAGATVQPAVPQQVSVQEAFAPFVPAQSTPSTAEQTSVLARGHAAAVDTGEATARLPEAQSKETAPTSKDEQVHMVATWLDEAEESGTDLKGTDIAHRLNLAPRTARRRLAEAQEYRAARQRSAGRGHLRPVADQV